MVNRKLPKRSTRSKRSSALQQPAVISESERQPHDPLAPRDQEELYLKIRQAFAIALYMSESTDLDGKIAADATAVIVDLLHMGRRIMELGSEHAALAQAAQR